MHDKTNCKKCNKELERMELFPNDLCLDCYKDTKQALKEYSQALWGKTVQL